MNAHPSFLQLDLVHLGTPGSPGISAHVEGCEQCRRYIGSLSEPAVIPSGLRSRLAAPRGAKVIPFRPLVLVLCALAASVLAVASFSAAGPPAVVRPKGAPEAELFLKRGEAVALWDGGAPVRSTDLLRLAVRPGEFSYLVVTGSAGHEPARRLWEGSVTPQERTLLPLSWQLDAITGPATLHLVFSRPASEGEPKDEQFQLELRLNTEPSP